MMPSTEFLGEVFDARRIKTTARDIMTLDVVTAYPHTSLRFVARLFAERHISAVPVVDDDRHVLGIVSENDLLQWSDLPGEKQVWWLNMLADGFELAPDFLDVIQSEREKVRGVMKTDVATVTEDAAVADIAKLMIAKSVKRVPVVRDGKLVGIVAVPTLCECSRKPNGPRAGLKRNASRPKCL